MYGVTGKLKMAADGFELRRGWAYSSVGEKMF